MPSALPDRASWIEARVPVPWREQIKTWFCGAACVEMLLESFGHSIDQSLAYEGIHNEARFQVERMYSDPEGIKSYVNTNNNDVDMIDVVDIKSDDKKYIVDNIYRMLYAFKTPVIILVFGGDHWVVIDGVRYTDTIDGAKEYAGFYVQNPWRGSTPGLWVSLEEFFDRWLLPNKFGESWLHRLVMLGNMQNARVYQNSVARVQALSRVDTGVVEPEIGAIELLGDLGFRGVRPISGGGALVTDPFLVRNEDTGGNYQVVPIDAIQNGEFKDFIYVVTDEATTKIMEVSSQSEQLDIPTIEEAQQAIKLTFGVNNDVSIDNLLYWRSRRGAVSKLDVYRKAKVNTDTYHILRDRSIVRQFTASDVGG